MPHTRLLQKLRAYCVGGNLLSWIQHFLVGRKPRVTVIGKLSDWATVLSRIPQGSVLGPILILVIFLNYLLEMIWSTAKIFADDTNIFNRIITRDDHVRSRQTVTSWLNGQKNGSSASMRENASLASSRWHPLHLCQLWSKEPCTWTACFITFSKTFTMKDVLQVWNQYESLCFYTSTIVECSQITGIFCSWRGSMKTKNIIKS